MSLPTWTAVADHFNGLLVEEDDPLFAAAAESDATGTDPRVQGVRRLTELIAVQPRWTGATVRSVDAKGYDGFTLALVTG
ncbi:hypothetical protein ACFVZW_23925 [Streptomyces sp. NPDC059567]|uniref:hypothetical protein n=1 Tax=Streptomyces sp. NPDC059567 TaxID=3346867 RepID=UPI0036AD24A3